MGLFSWFKKEKRNQEESQQPQQVPYRSPFSNGALFFGQYVNANALSLSTVFAAVDIISNSLAELPIQVKEIKSDCNDILPNHPISKLFNNLLISKFIFIKQLIVDMLLYGNGYAYIQKDSNGAPIDLIYLEHGDVEIDYIKDTRVLRYKISGKYKGVPKIVLPKQMIHLYKNSNDGIKGRGILSYANRTITIGNYTEEAAKDYFGSGCGIKGILKFNEQVLDVDKEEIRKNWQQVHGGSDGSGLAVCDFNCEFIPVSQSANESQMIETRQFNVTEVARYFNISPVLLQDLSHSSYSTIEASQLEFLIHTLLPYISLIESEFNRKLGEDGIIIDLDEKYLMSADKNTEANYIKNLISSGVICVNEGRRMLGFGPIEGGDKHIIAYTNIDNNTINKEGDETNEDDSVEDESET